MKNPMTHVKDHDLIVIANTKLDQLSLDIKDIKNDLTG